jgi:predicted exporter
MTIDAPPAAERVRTRKRWMLIGIALAVIVSATGWARLKFDNSLEPLLPERSEARQTILFFRDSSFASKAILWFRLRGDSGSLADLYAAADATEKRLDPHLIKRVIRAPDESSALDEIVGLLDDAGELLNESDLTDIEKATRPDALKKRMRELYIQLVAPQGGFMTQITRRDPLGVSARILARLDSLRKGMGFKVELHSGHLVNSDGRQMLMMLETSSDVTSMASSRALAKHLNDLVAATPPNVEIIPISGLIHAQENEQLMTRDIRLAAILNTAFFVLLFFLVSRDLRVGAVFLLPLMTTAITIGWCALVHPTLSTMMIGLAVTMAGSAVDYGIFVYTAVTMGRDKQVDLRKIRKPLIISHLTTLGVFIAFLFSKIPAFRELGWMTTISLIMSLLAALFVLPEIIRPTGKLTLLGRGMPLEIWGRKVVIPAFILAVAFVAAVVIATKIRIDPDVTRLDGVSPAVKQAEADFGKTWSQSDKPMGIIVVTGKTRDDAEQANDRLAAAAQDKFGSGEFVSLSRFWPSGATRRANWNRWRAFWSPDRIEKLQQDMSAAGEPYGFSVDAFKPFFDSLTKPPREDQPHRITEALEEQFVARSGTDWQMLTYFEDTPKNLNTARTLAAGRDDVLVVSRAGLGQAFADSAASETKVLVGITTVFIIASLLVLTRSIGKSAVIMLPAITGLATMLAILYLIAQGLSIVTVIAAILVLALGSDYGVFAVYAWEGREKLLGQGMSSVFLSFLTTLAGVGAMLLALHPALFLAGVSLTSGLVAAYLTALICLPAMQRLIPAWRPE